MDRREFIKSAAIGAVVLTSATGAVTQEPTPWYRRAIRWGQTNITERDPVRYDIPWWREYWKRTAVQGVIINAGGIVAYYPSKFPLQHRAEFLGDRDLYGELASAAHEDGLAVLARMIAAVSPKTFSRRILIGSRAGHPVRHTRQPTSTSPASTAHIMTSTFRASCRRSSSGRTRKVSVTIAGAA